MIPRLLAASVLAVASGAAPGGGRPALHLRGRGQDEGGVAVPAGFDYQQYAGQYGSNYQQYMQGQGAGGSNAQGGDYQQYMQGAGDYQQYMQGSGDYQKYLSNGGAASGRPASSSRPTNLLATRRDVDEERLKERGAKRSPQEKGEASTASGSSTAGGGFDYQQYLSQYVGQGGDYKQYMQGGAPGRQSAGSSYKQYMQGSGGDYQNYMQGGAGQGTELHAESKSSSAPGGGFDYNRFVLGGQSSHGGYQQYVTRYARGAGASGSNSSYLPASQNMSQEQAMQQYASPFIVEVRNKSDSKEWNDKFMKRYMPADFKKFAKNVQSESQKASNTPMSAGDCTTVKELREWKEAHLKLVHSFVPKEFQQAAENNTQAEFEDNKARIESAAAAAKNATAAAKNKTQDEELSYATGREAATQKKAEKASNSLHGSDQKDRLRAGSVADILRTGSDDIQAPAPSRLAAEREAVAGGLAADLARQPVPLFLSFAMGALVASAVGLTLYVVRLRNSESQPPAGYVTLDAP